MSDATMHESNRPAHLRPLPPQPDDERGPQETGSFPASRGLLVRPLLKGDTRAQNLRRDSHFRRALAVADALAALVALAATVYLLDRGRIAWPTLLTVPGVVLFAKLRGLYDSDALVLRRSTLDEVPHLFELATGYALVAWLLDGALVSGAGLDRTSVLLLWGVLLVLVVIGRATARAIARRVTSTERCMLIGRHEMWSKLETVIRHRRGLELVSYFPMRTRQGGRYEPLNLAIAHARARIARAVAEDNVHRVIIAVGESNDEGILDAIFVLEGLGLKVSVVPHMLEVVGSAGEFEDLEGTLILGVGHFGLSRSSTVIKRVFDLALGALLTLLAVPMLVAIAVTVKLSSSGPVLFRQPRVGRDGEVFQMLKFRTMYDGADALRDELATRNETSGLFKLTLDPRVTPVGRLLRSSSLDELPQLFNVLRGEMSLVGPRPLILEEDSKVLGWARRRLHLTPGMTGPWQVLGATRVPLQEMVKVDYLYIANWSLWGDIKALLRTFPHVLGRRGL
jgi:exopolysaccharide biosynthesis polyprenyl glycosylphosphotransferase